MKNQKHIIESDWEGGKPFLDKISFRANNYTSFNTNHYQRETYELKTTILPRNKIAFFASSAAIIALVAAFNTGSVIGGVVLAFMGIATVAAILKSRDYPFVVIKKTDETYDPMLKPDPKTLNSDGTNLLYGDLHIVTDDRLKGLWL